jgi:tetratricopeptide (TPR) repeat protein
LIYLMPLFLVACSSTTVNDKETIAQLRNMHVEIEEEEIEGGLEKAMESYQRFLEETPDSALAPEAIRRLADLKVEEEYGLLTGAEKPEDQAQETSLSTPERAVIPKSISEDGHSAQPTAPLTAQGESEEEFENRATQNQQEFVAGGMDGSPENRDDLERKGPLEAIELYKKLLRDYPQYQRNDQVLYQMSRAYEELGRIEEAMEVMDTLVREFPQSRYMDEVQFRRAEYFFTHRKYLDAEDAYSSIVDMGVGSLFYELALFKLGWTFYKQELYEDALHKYIALLDHKVAVGYDFEQTEDETEHKRLEDTFRVISLSFSYLGGADAVVDYFSRFGSRSYEDGIYGNLGEYYFDKRRYSDATATYNAFVNRNPFHEKSPHFFMRVIEINKAGGFPTLVIDSKKEFARRYGLQAEYWQYFEPSDYPEVLGYLKTNLTDLANHYHALYQDPKYAEEKKANFEEALHWYREFLVSFPAEEESPAINYQLADLLLENHSFGEAAVEYEKTAYDYPRHEKSAQAGYAAVYAYRENLGAVPEARKNPIKREVVRSSLKFADTFPEHEKAAIVLGAAVDDLYDMKEYEQAVDAGRKLIEKFPEADMQVLRAAWLVVAHSSYELNRFNEAETAYVKVLALLPADDKARDALVNNLAASIYKQGEQARELEDFRTAADHFLRVGRLAPTSKIRPAAEYDAAAALIQLKDWEMATTVLLEFRKTFPGHKLQPEVTKKIAYVYKENGQLSLAADEYERIERESQDGEVRRGALLLAAELHEKTGNTRRVLEVYRRYVGLFPQPVETNLETRNKIAEILKAENDQKGYLSQLREIVDIDASAGGERTDRTRYLAAHAALVLAEQSYEQFVEVKLVNPIEENLRKKQGLMKTVTKEFGKLPDYGVGEVTAAATFYLAEIYSHFSKALTESERPEGLSPLELEEYELAIEEQAYPFEEKAIDLHEKNLELISKGIYNEWIDKSLQKLAKFVPVRYDKPEEISEIITSLDTYEFAFGEQAPPASPVADEQAPGPAAESAQFAPVTESAPPVEQAGTKDQFDESGPKPGTQPEPTAVPVQAEETIQTAKAAQVEPSAPIAEPEAGAKPEPLAEPGQAEVATQPDESGSITGSESPPEPESGTQPETAVEEPVQVEETVRSANAEQVEESLPTAEPESGAKPEPIAEPVQAEEQAQPDESGPITKSEPPSEPEPGIQPETAVEAMQVEETAPKANAEQVEESMPISEPAAGAKPEPISEPVQAERPAQLDESVPVIESEPSSEPEPAIQQKTAAEEPEQVEETAGSANAEQVEESMPIEEPGANPEPIAEPVQAEEQARSASAEQVEESVQTAEPSANPELIAKPVQAEEQSQPEEAEPKQEAEPTVGAAGERVVSNNGGGTLDTASP